LNVYINISSNNNVVISITTPYILRVIFYTIATFGILLNLFTITIIAMYKPMHKQLMNMFIVNQSVIDTLAAIILIFSTLFQNNSMSRKSRNIQDEALCRLWFSEMWMWATLLSSTYGIMAVTFERYLAVVHPIWHKAKFTRRKAQMLIVLVWIIGPCYYCPHAIATAEVTNDGRCSIYTYYHDVVGQHFSATFEFIINYIFPISSLAYFYVGMILALRRISPIIHQQQDVGERKQTGEERPISTVVQVNCNGDSVLPTRENVAQEIPNKLLLTVLMSGVNIEIPEEVVEVKSKFAELARSEQPSSSKVYVVQVEPVEIPNVKILESIIEGDKNVVNVKEKTEVSPSCTTPQGQSPLKLKIEEKKKGNIELLNNIKYSGRVVAKSVPAPKESASTARAKRNVIKTLAFVSCGFIMCWTWSEVSFFINDLGLVQLDFDGVFYNFTTVMVFTSCCINPVVYGIQYQQFQKGVKYVVGHNRVWIYLFGGLKIDPVGTGKIRVTQNMTML